MLDTAGFPTALASDSTTPARLQRRTTTKAKGSKRKIRIAFVITRADAVGGASIHVRDMARMLLSCGHTACVFLGGEGAVTEALKVAGVPYQVVHGLVRNVAPKQDLRAVFRLRKALAAFEPDLVSTHTSKAGVIGRLAAWSLGIPALYTPHCWSFVDGFPGARLYLWAERLVRPFGRRTIMVSEAERRDGIRHRVGPSDHFVTVHNGMPDITPDLRAEPGKQGPRIVMVGRFEQQKDHETLLLALARLKHLCWSLDLVGDGPLRKTAEELARSLGLLPRVVFHGYRKDVSSILSKAQIFALITNWEGFPRSIIEAMRAGLPIVASDVGGNAESVQDGVNGLVVRKRDAAAVAKALACLIQDTELRVRMGAAGRDAYEREFTLERMVHKTAEVWSSVLGHEVQLPVAVPVSAAAPAAAVQAN
ncbi:MAG: glycosyltransferase family 4 protein [Opitutaceae bacterium]|nr:glycosyltransferase family 4 protein [Opitutaceae bacterium]